jgi:hypothetical protein
MGTDRKLFDQGTVQFFEATANGVNKATVQAPATLAADYTLTLPVDDGGANEFLKTDGSGVLSWGTSTATLDSAYDNGSTITADAGQVEINGNGNVGLFLNQDSDHAALSVDSEATGSPLLLLAAINGNSRGDIALGTARTGDPSSPSEGDIWYNSTDKNLYVRTDAASIDLTQQNTDTQNDLDGAYTDGQSITVDSGAIAISGSATSLMDLTQSGDFAGATITKTGVGAGRVLSIEDDGTGGAAFLNQDGNAIALEIDSEATGQPLLSLSAAAANSRGDITFGTARLNPASSPVESDIWYDGSEHRWEGYTGSGNYTLGGAFNMTPGPGTAIQLSSGVLTLTQSYCFVTSESGATDDLDTITAADSNTGDIIVLRPTSGDTITVKHGTGNITLSGGADRVLTPANGSSIMLQNTGGNWNEVSYTA